MTARVLEIYVCDCGSVMHCNGAFSVCQLGSMFQCRCLPKIALIVPNASRVPIVSLNGRKCPTLILADEPWMP